MDNKYVYKLNVQKKSVLKKLYVAVSMLLVATLLVTSASYAWLTLSLAPEVSNVTTTIGSNGNLEIALGKNIGESAVGDSFKENDATITNRTWGNLIDLTDASYGLQSITLRPAILNSAGGSINKLHPLTYPIYGSDGRVKYVYANNMFAGTYKDNQFVTTPNEFGVHGIGTTAYHALGGEGTFGPLSQRQEMFYYAQDALWTMTSSSYLSLCESNQNVLVAYCRDGKGVSSLEFDLGSFYNSVMDVVSAANEELRLIFTLMAASETTSADKYFMGLELLKQEYPDYEMIHTLVSSAIQTENVEGISTAISELRAFQNAVNQLKAAIDSGKIDNSDGYSMEEISQTVGVIFDLEKTSFSDTSKDYWSKVIPNLYYRKYLENKYWRWSYPGNNDFAVSDITKELSDSEGQDNDSREDVSYEIKHTHTYSLYRSLPLETLDTAIVDLYSDHWIYWENCAEEYQNLQSEVAQLEAQVKELEDAIAELQTQNNGDSTTLEAELLEKNTVLSDKKVQLQSLIDGETYALNDSRLQAIQSVMTDTLETLRLYTLWSIAYDACDGQVPDDAYYRILEMVSSSEYIHPRAVYRALCNYGVTPHEELTNMVISYESLENELLFLQKKPDNSEEVTWSVIDEELQRIFGNIKHHFSFVDNGYIHDIYANYIAIENTPFPIDVLGTIREEIKKCETAIESALTTKNAIYRIEYRDYDDETYKPWTKALGLLTSFSHDSYPFEYGKSENTLTDCSFSVEHSMSYAQSFHIDISIGVGSEDNFNESGLTVRQTRFQKAQQNIAYYQNQLITAAVSPDRSIASLLMQIIAGDSSVSLKTIAEYLNCLQKQLESGESMMYQAGLAMASSNYAEDDVYKYAYSDQAPKNAYGMIELLQRYDFDSTVLYAFAQRMILLDNQKTLLNQSMKLLEGYHNPETGTWKSEQIPTSEAVTILNPVLDTSKVTLYGYVPKNDSNKKQEASYVHTVLYAGYGKPSVQINGNQAIIEGREPITVYGDIYMSIDRSFSGSMLALAKSQTESYTPPVGAVTIEKIKAAENGVNCHSYTIDTSTKLYTLNLRTADAPFSLETDLWSYTGNTDYISANQILIDVYGYSIDLSFRTNAENSDLLLQTEAIDRIYNDGETQIDTTMGAGSYMEFEILSSLYSVEMAKEYMSCLRVVFTDNNTGYIYGYAALDMDAAEQIGVEIKAPLRLYDKDTGLMIEGEDLQYLCHLEKNQEKNLTIYVYLEGAKVSQSFVSTTSEQTLSGKMNLQFSSSVDLKPAEFGDLRK